ncbi:hypothetical protein [Hydrogenophaga sp.]|uniref:hypothetical protein n=1 Tax=Hydrogenophaga sp. TaxID=1904254 RepID=UPI003F72C52C
MVISPTRTPAQKLAMQAADQAYCLSLTLKTHNKLEHMILPQREPHPDHPCWIPVRPHFAELVHTFNEELARQLGALMQTLDAMQALMADEPQGPVGTTFPERVAD